MTSSRSRPILLKVIAITTVEPADIAGWRGWSGGMGGNFLRVGCMCYKTLREEKRSEQGYWPIGQLCNN